MARIQRPGSSTVAAAPARVRANRNNARNNARGRGGAKKTTGTGTGKETGSVQENLIQENPLEYLNVLGDRAGAYTTQGVSPFSEWVRNNGFADAQAQYSNELFSNNKLKFGDFMSNRYGTPTSQQQLAPVNTGNAFTSSSAPGTFQQFVMDKGKQMGQLGQNQKQRMKKKFKGARSEEDAVALGATGQIDPTMMANDPAQYANLLADWRRKFAHLTPEQAGTYNGGYAMGPSRWSVFG